MTVSCRRRAGWLLLLFLVGCNGQAPPRTVPVSGKVVLDGKPLADAVVTFTPLDAREEGKSPSTSTGRTDAQGQYSLTLDCNGSAGAVVGLHRVRVARMERGGDGKPARGQVIPVVYNSSSTLEFTVPAEGSSSANFELSSNPTAPSRRRPGR